MDVIERQVRKIEDELVTLIFGLAGNGWSVREYEEFGVTGGILRLEGC